MCRRAPGAFNDANGIHRLRNRPGCTFPHLSRDPRPVGSQPPFGVGQSSNPYPVDYRPAFASSDLPYPLTHRRALTGHFPPSLRGWLGLPRCTRVPILKDLGPALPPAVQPLRGEISRPSDLTAYLFGPCLSASWACCFSRRLSSGSHVLAISFNPSSRPPRGWQSQRPLTVRLPAYQAEATVSRALRTPGLPPAHGPVGYRWQNTGSFVSLINTHATSCRTSGSRVTSPSPGPLRTRRASFPAPGSSLDKAPRSTRQPMYGHLHDRGLYWADAKRPPGLQWSRSPHRLKKPRQLSRSTPFS